MKNKVQIGIPQALLYYQYLPMWKAFFEELGAELVISSPTTKTTVLYGCQRVVGDVCLPVKVFCGHVHNLKDNCDYVFIPSIHSVSPNAYNCPKIIGLSDLVSSCIPGCPSILDPDIDINKGKRQLNKAAYKLAESIGNSHRKARTALDKALDTNREYIRLMQQGLTPPQAIAQYLGQTPEENKDNVPDQDITIAVIGHPYMVYDSYINHNLVSLVQNMGVRVVFSSMVSSEKRKEAVEKLVGKAYWGYEEEIIGAGGYYLESDVDGIIGISAFGCGPDSLMMELLRRYAIKANKPFLPIILDEHTSDGGLITRVEAFVDMIRRRGKSPPQNFYINRLDTNRQGGIKILGLPNMANLTPAFRASVEMLGITMVNPPVTRQTITLGSRYSPEFACLPFKGMLGTFIESLEMGADSLLMVSSSNACRMGYYARVHEQILRDMGYKFKLFRATDSDKGIIGILRLIKRLSNDASWPRIIAAYRLGTAKLKALDNLERMVEKYRALEIEKGRTSKIYREAIKAIDKAVSLSSVKMVAQQYSEELDLIPKNLDYSPLRVGIIGAFYVRVEPFVNKNLESNLGMLGVEVRRTKTTFFSEWANPFSYLNVLNNENRNFQKYAEPYLKRDVGGYGLESVGEKVRLSREEYDGLVHIAPFTCMPEAIAQNVMLNTREDIPVLTILCDEHMGEAGTATRLEAFVDLMERRRRRKNEI